VGGLGPCGLPVPSPMDMMEYVLYKLEFLLSGTYDKSRYGCLLLPKNMFYAGNAEETWILDLKNGSGSVTKGDGDSDVTMTMSDNDFVQMFKGKLNATAAFMQGKLKIDGNMMMAMKLEKLMKSVNKSKL